MMRQDIQPMMQRIPRPVRQAASPKCLLSLRPAHRNRLAVGSLLLVLVTGWLGYAQSPDNAARSAEILAHLNAAIHFYRTSTSFTQKVGEPSDALYHDQALTLSTRIVQLAFQSAKAEAVLMRAQQPATTGQQGDASSDQKRIVDLETANQTHIDQLKTQLATINKQIDSAPAAKYRSLLEQRNSLQGQLDLAQSMQQSLDKVITFVDANSPNASGLAGNINRLEMTAPILAPTNGPAIAAANNAARQAAAAALPISSLQNAQASGVVGQAEVIFDLLNNFRQLHSWMTDNDQLRAQATKLHDPLVTMLRQTIQQGQTMAQNAAAAAAQPPAPPAKPGSRKQPAPAAVAPAPSAPTLKDYQTLAARFNQISAASVPLAQEIMLLNQSRQNLQQWSDAIDSEYDSIVRSLLLRVFFIALAIGLIFLFGEAWRRASVKYVQDMRRRRQLLVIRNFIIGFCMGLVLILGFVTQFSSLATFAGFITAGIAVGLQTILLSVAAYFFIVGRYGVRIGDRISVAGVTGDVIDVGIVRLYLMELAGTGIDLHPTGRVAVFSNAVLFQATTPLYKQIPGTEYGWHDVAVKMNEAADFKQAAQKISATVESVCQQYQPEIERQHTMLAQRWDVRAYHPKPNSQLQYVDNGLEFKVRYPVLLRHAAEVDGQLTQALLTLIQGDEAIMAAVQGPPVIRASVKM